jgi:hypothetical protein
MGKLGSGSFLLLRAFCEAGLRHSFTEAAFFEERFLELADLLIEKVVGLVDKADHDVGDHFRRARLDIGPVGLIGPIFLRAEFADIRRFFAILVPQLEAGVRRKSR